MFSSIIKNLFEKDPLSFIFGIILIAVVIVGLLLLRKHMKPDESPDFLDHKGYYKIALTPTGYKITDQGNVFRTLSSFYYLRKDPFPIEVCLEEIQADNGKTYRARAIAMMILPEGRVDYVCRRYFNGDGNAASKAEIMSAVMTGKPGMNPVADILSDNSQNRKTSSDEMLKQILAGNARGPSIKERQQEKTNCDGDIDMELTISLSSALKSLITEHGGTLSDEEMKKKFLGQAMLCAMTAGHAVTEITVFNIMENT